jgi:hypothetical protein
MARPAHRLNITLDAENAVALKRLAERLHAPEETLAGSLLSMAIEDADSENCDVAAVLDGIPDAYERAQLGLDHGVRGETVGLDEL